MQNLIQMYHAVQVFWAFSLTEHNWLKWCSANPRPSKKAIAHAKGWIIMLTCICMQNLIKIWHVVQELWAFILTLTDRHMDGLMEGRAQIVIIEQTQRSCNFFYQLWPYIWVFHQNTWSLTLSSEAKNHISGYHRVKLFQTIYWQYGCCIRNLQLRCDHIATDLCCG